MWRPGADDGALMMEAQAIEALRNLTSTTSIEDAWSLLQQQMAQFGFDRLLYASTRFRTDQSAVARGDVEDALILTNHPADYMAEFIGNGLYLHAPNVKWVMRNTGAVSWRETSGAAHLSTEQATLAALNARFGLTAGYTLSFPEVSTRAAGGIGLSSSHLCQDQIDALWAQQGALIEVLATVAHLKINDLPYQGRRRVLTDRQRQTLELVADGKTAQDIAVLTGLTAATVEKHLRLARETLDAETTAQAILKAAIQNQFFVVKAPPRVPKN